MNISVFGLGYVGAVTAGCLAKYGHTIVGVDVQAQKVDSLNSGVSPIVEPGLDELLSAANRSGLLHATTSVEEAIAGTEMSLVCVGTPSKASGAIDLGFVRLVVQDISAALRRKQRHHTLVLRSTMLPGSTDQLVEEFLSDLLATDMVEIFYYPEFLREGTGVADFLHPSLAVVGSRDGTRPPEQLMTDLFGHCALPVPWSTAEMVKYACNAFHATKIVFANEMGRLCKQLGVDSRAVMDLLCRDTKLNLSSYYLKPGNPFGGSCLPKDVRALVQHTRVSGVNLPLVEHLVPSNEEHLQDLLALITDSGENEVCIMGLAFKGGTDDLRGAPMVEVAQTLLGRGFKVRVYDPMLNLGALVGSNKRAIDVRMPHLASLLCTDLSIALGDRGVVVVAQQCARIEDLQVLITVDHRILDVNGWPELQQLPCRYEGLCW